jgi:signal transduction histidine kinase
VGGFAAVTVGAPGLLMRPGHGSLSADLVGLVLVAVMVVLLRHAVGLFVLLPDRMLPVLPGARTRGPTAGAGSLDSAARGADDQLHEVRASLAGLSSALHLLTDQDRLTGADRAHLSGMLGSEIERLQRLLDCPGSQPAQPVALHAVPAPMIATRRAAGQDVRLGEMHCACCRDGCCPACTLACPDAVEEIINILLVNAATHAPGATVVVSGSARDGRVQLRVSDDGPGVPGHLRADLFTRGVRREGSPGHGIGLELARRLARSQHGDLWLEDAPVGASFVLEVPAIVGEACA